MSVDQEMLNDFIDESVDIMTRWEAVCISLSKTPSEELWSDLFRSAHNLKGGSRMAGLMEFGEFIHKIEDGITELRDGKASVTVGVISALLKTQKFVTDWVDGLRTDPHFTLNWQPLAEAFRQELGRPGAPAESTAALSPQVVALESVSEEQSKIPPAEIKVETVHPAQTQLSSDEGIKDVKKLVTATKQGANAHETVRISAAKLDQLLQVIGELSIHQSIIWHARQSFGSAGKIITHSVQLSQKLTKELYDRALALRMQPIQGLFQRMERNIFDLAKTLNKEVNLTLKGGDVELDKAVLEKIVDPLTHIVRNAIDHGIENGADRISSGKNGAGNITISASHDTSGVEIKVSDDGKGLVLEKIVAKARAKGLIAPHFQPKKEDVFQLILLPGFSTAEKVTEVSGRGVGMDVVKRAVEELQ